VPHARSEQDADRGGQELPSADHVQFTATITTEVNMEDPQCWLDVSHHPARGAEMADLLWRRVIQPHYVGGG
jgi:hypothetical protein